MTAVPVRRRRRRDPHRRCTTSTPASGTASWPASGPARPTASGRTAPTTRRAACACNPAKLLLDPYARAIDGDGRVRPRGARRRPSTIPTRPAPLDSAAYVPRSLVVDPTFDWGDDAPSGARLRRHASSTRSTSRASPWPIPDVPPELRGTYAGLAHDAAIAHLVDLGVTAVRAAARCTSSVPEAFLVERGLHQLLGLQHHRLLRAPRRLLGGRPRRATRRPGAPSSRRWCDAPARRRPRGAPRRGLQPHRRGQRRSARRCATGASTTRPTTGSTPAILGRYVDTTGCGNSLNVGDPIVPAADHGLAALLGRRRCTSTASASTSPRRWPARHGAFDQSSAFFDLVVAGPGRVARPS